jgi:GNAT superfamily N-acetyltransferase
MNTTGTPLVRPARETDIAALARLRYEFRVALKPVDEPAAAFVDRCSEWMREHLAPHGDWVAWVLDVDGDVTGTLWMHVMDKIPNPVVELERLAYVTNVYVVPAHRGVGGGSMLLRAAIDACEALEVDKMFLWPTARSRPLYARHGFGTQDDVLVRQIG